MESINFNGNVYNNLDEMPADQRAAYEQVMSFMKDENHNGIPDVFEGDVVQKMMTMASTRVIINGQEMQNIDSMPPEARAKFNQAMAKLGQLGISISEDHPQMAAQSSPQIAPSEPAFQQSPSFMQSSPSAITEDQGSRAKGIIGIIAAFAVLFLCALVVAAFFLFNH